MKSFLFSRKSSKAFTLVELATVLLIVAALVASILSGKALKDSADISTIVDNVKKIDASAITFSSIYGGIPGTVDPMINTALQSNISYTGSTGSVSTVFNPIYDAGSLLISKEYFNKSIVYNATKFNPVFESWRHISLSGVLPNIQSKIGTHACDGTVATLACTAATTPDLSKTKNIMNAYFPTFSLLGSDLFLTFDAFATSPLYRGQAITDSQFYGHSLILTSTSSVGVAATTITLPNVTGAGVISAANNVLSDDIVKKVMDKYNDSKDNFSGSIIASKCKPTQFTNPDSTTCGTPGTTSHLRFLLSF
jgi:hypothetical protein